MYGAIPPVAVIEIEPFVNVEQVPLVGESNTESLDIDTELDFELAEYLLNLKEIID